MRIASIKEIDTENGIGIGMSIFVQGCPFHCHGCFNESTWDFDGGEVYDQSMEDRVEALVKRHYISRVSILGGEPFCEENRIDVCKLIHKIKEWRPDISIWVYTGYVFESALLRLLFDVELWTEFRKINVLVDGPFIEAEKDISLAFRGSCNQRIIDISKTFDRGGIVLWEHQK